MIIRSHGEGRAVYDQLRARGVEILDATCPNVTRIHQIVAQAEEAGRQPVIVGTPDHPEVTAIAGWCSHPVVVVWGGGAGKLAGSGPKRRRICPSLLSPKPRPPGKFGMPA